MLKKSKVSKYSLLILVVFLLFTFTFGIIHINAAAMKGTKGTMRDISSLELTKEMKVGWNLGNTLDAFGGETNWGNPKTTKAMIDEIKSKGFNTLRIPITWKEHVSSAPDYTIDEEWMDRVQEVVDYGIDNNMYVIINTHHESEWLIPTYDKETQVKEKLTKIWAQIAERFKNYSDYLVFEIMNEPRVEGSDNEWTGGTSECREVINHLNLAAVNIIRDNGGNNALRHIMIPSHAASTTSSAVNDIVIPNNDSRIIVSLHMYSPYYFSMVIDETAVWGSDSDKSSLKSEFETIYNKFIKNGRAVVLGEFGSINKDNLSARITHASFYAKSAREIGIPVIWWDNGIPGDGTEKESYAIFNRNELTWYFPEIANALIKNSSTPEQNCSVLYKIQNDWFNGASVNLTIKNNTSSEINEWELKWNFPGTQKINSLWNGSYEQNGSEVTVKNLDWNQTIAPSSSVSIGFNLFYDVTNNVPSYFTLNGIQCSVD
ncbi:MAG: cellulase family glycosylhydrolase [Clostridiales bacterium]